MNRLFTAIQTRFWPARWCSGKCICFAVGRPGVHSVSRVIPKDFKKWYSQLPCLAHSIKKWWCGEQAGKLAFCVLGQGTLRHVSTFMWQTGGPPVLYRITIVKLPTQHVVKDDSWVPTGGSPPCWWWGYQSLMTGSKWAAIFPLA